MRELLLLRGPSTEFGTFGEFLENNVPICLSLERPWLDNQHDVSCIPEGIYTCNRISSEWFKYVVFEVLNVPNRTNIEIHKANIFTELKGCIAPGSSHGKINGIPGVLDSGLAFEKFMLLLKGENEFRLTIKNA